MTAQSGPNRKTYTVHELLKRDPTENPERLRLTRTVTPVECDWLSRTYRMGEIVCRYTGPTYGCCRPEGMACSDDGDIPFYELPRSALEPVDA
jgi:hypothetical protein